MLRLRRRALVAALSLSASVFGLATRAPAQGSAPPQPAGPPTVHQVRPNVYWMEIPKVVDSNDSVIVGPTGLVLVDTSISHDNEKLFLAEIAKISSKPIVAVILTHNDGDHTNGLADLPQGVQIIAQQNCKDLMEKSAARGGRGAADPNFMPTKTYDKRLTLTLGGEKVELYHWAPAHTAGDTIVYLPKEKVVFGGDLLITMIPMPFLHMEEGGSARGWVESMRGMAKLDSDTYIAGHGPAIDKAEVNKRLAAGEKEQADTLKLMGEGKSLDQIHEALGETKPIMIPGIPVPLDYFSTYVYKDNAKK